MNGAKVLADTLKFHGKIETLRLGWCQVCHESCNHLVSPEPLCYLRTSSLLLLELRWTSKISLSSLSTFPSQSYSSCFSCPPSPLHTWWSLLDPVCSFLHWLLVNAEVSHTVTETKFVKILWAFLPKFVWNEENASETTYFYISPCWLFGGVSR